ncbi:winged helix-turn-helix transcriptional regulator [Agrobacterium sp. Ap1]|uniref:Lrp/AsnC family transcriptional regulator n=1 Tax=Agrobacterium sp. Ap1 TaxID=2815337 RepID=UPI002570C7ED|nr:winged helix-turn-helix transcriptional regulator [Agrobacterium sp. Ap1]
MSKAKSPSDLQTAKSTLNATDARILDALDSDARLSMSELARLVGMSAPSVSERVRRLEAAGITNQRQIARRAKRRRTPGARRSS